MERDKFCVVVDGVSVDNYFKDVESKEYFRLECFGWFLIIIYYD